MHPTCGPVEPCLPELLQAGTACNSKTRTHLSVDTAQQEGKNARFHAVEDRWPPARDNQQQFALRYPIVTSKRTVKSQADEISNYHPKHCLCVTDADFWEIFRVGTSVAGDFAQPDAFCGCAVLFGSHLGWSKWLFED